MATRSRPRLSGSEQTKGNSGSNSNISDRDRDNDNGLPVSRQACAGAENKEKREGPLTRFLVSLARRDEEHLLCIGPALALLGLSHVSPPASSAPSRPRRSRSTGRGMARVTSEGHAVALCRIQQAVCKVHNFLGAPAISSWDFLVERVWQKVRKGVFLTRTNRDGRDGRHVGGKAGQSCSGKRGGAGRHLGVGGMGWGETER